MNNTLNNKALKQNTIYTIVNPVSSNGKTEHRWPDHKEKIIDAGIDLKIKMTHYPGHAVKLTQDALKMGYRTIMAVGGDGTVNEVLNGFYKNGEMINQNAVLLIFSQGTGSDYIRSLNLTKNVYDIIDIYKRYNIRKVDIGKITYLDFDNIERTRYFINTADVGIGGETVEFVNQSSKIMGGLLTYLYGVIRTLIKYENKKMKLKIDDKVVKDDILNSIMISLGKYFAGGMPIAPEAKVDDGIFDITILGNLSKIETVLNLYRAYKGTHIYYKKIDYLKGKKISIESDKRVLIDIDGECAGILPAEFEIYKQVFPILD